MCMYAFVGVACYNLVARAAPPEAAAGSVDWFVGWVVSGVRALEAIFGITKHRIKVDQGYCSSSQ